MVPHVNPAMKKKIDYGIALRVSIDAILFVGSQVVAYMLRYIYAAVFENLGPSASDLFKQYMRAFLVYLPLMAVLGLLSFTYFGLYSRTRTYNWRAKALTVTKAVTAPYLLVPLVLFTVPAIPVFLLLPRSVLFIAWGITLAATLVARTWSILWRHLVIQESGAEIQQGRDERKVLLIGGAGYIGSALLPKLLESGYRVRLLDLFLYGREPIRECLDHPNLEIVEGDFRQVEKVVSAMQGVGSVIHLGGIVGDPACALDEQLTIEINLVATRTIAEVAKGGNVRRFIFASTCSVYGASDSMLDESSILNPASLYARSKIASEKVLLQSRDAGFSPVILRFGTIFGFSGRTRFDLVVNLLTAKAVLDGKITLYGGDQWRPFVHVDDAARAVMTVLESPIEQVGGEIFNIGGDHLNCTLQQVGEIIQRMVPSAELLDLGTNADRRNYQVDFRKVRRILGYQPKWKLEEGIAQVIEAIRSGKVTDYTLSKYSNVKLLDDEKIHVLNKESGWERRVLESIAPFEPTGT
jgi:nucleoside-diphosphate-sugar epimerase